MGKQIPLTRAVQFAVMAEALEDSGVCPERLTRRLSIPMWQFYDPQELIPVRHIFQLIDLAAKATGSALLGFQIMDRAPVYRWGPLINFTAHAPSLYQGIKAFVRLLPVHGSSTQWWLEETADNVWLCRGGDSQFESGESLMTQYCLAGMVQMVRLGAGADWRPSIAKVQGANNLRLDETEMFCDTRLFPDPFVSAVAVPRSILSRPMSRRSLQTVPNCDASDDEMWTTVPSSDFVGSLRQVIVTLVKEGYPHIKTAAEIAQLSVRALQRELQRQGTNYTQVVEGARFEAAKHLLEHTDSTVSDLAFDLGYSDLPHFIRAFHRWGGITPGEYRRLNVTK